MDFCSMLFIVCFLPLFLIVYYLVPFKCRNAVILLGSLIGYGIQFTKWLPMLIIGMLVNFICYRVLCGMNSDGKGYKVFLWGTIAGNLAVLVLEKRSDEPMPGISFFVFCTIAFFVDVCLRKKKKTEVLGFWEFGAYLTFFPKMISGPITRWEAYRKNLPLTRESEKQLWRNLERGITLFIIGLGYKVLLADSLAALWNEIQTIGFESISTLLAWMGMFAYSLEIYFDFQGYSLMAIGVAAMMGIALPVNFLTPYASLSVSEFYRRWHVTLGAWFRDYVYIPLGGNRKGMWKTIRNLAVVWALTGLWHGMHWNFLLWAGILFLCICLERLGLRKWLEKWPWLGHLYVWLVIPLSWMPFAIHNKDEILAYFGSLFGVVGAAMRVDDIWVAGGKYLPYFFLAFVLAVTTTRRRSQAVTWEDKKPWIEETTVNHAGSLWQVLALGLIFWWAVYKLSVGSVNPFMYFSF